MMLQISKENQNGTGQVRLGSGTVWNLMS